MKKDFTTLKAEFADKVKEFNRKMFCIHELRKDLEEVIQLTGSKSQ